MEKSDHVAVTVCMSPEVSVTSIKDSQHPQIRKSLRRSWNQMPRLQRNFIIAGILAICVIFFLFLPGDRILNEDIKVLSKTAALPFHSNNDQGVEKILNKDNSPIKKELNENNRKDFNQVVEAPQLNVDHVKVSEPQEPQTNAGDPTEKSIENLIHESTKLNENNFMEKTIIQDDRTILETAVHEPMLLPGTNGVTIDQFIAHMDNDIEDQKMHFHGASNERQTAVVAAFQHSWKGYKKYAWGHDNLKPLTQTSHEWFGLGLTIVDSLDTMYIMGLEDEFKEARNWINEHLSFDINRDVNLFEVTIRVLGSLLTTYHFSGDKIFLKKSIELGNRLLPCFLSPSGIPYSDVNLASMSAHSPKWSPDSSTSEVTTIQLEFRALSRASNIPIYERVANIVNEKVHHLEKPNGLVPIFINANSGTFRNYATISLGARGDSYYEYLLKQWIQTGLKENDDLIIDYRRSIEGVISKLKRTTPKEHLVFLGELINGKDFKPKMDHLTCYLPGTLLLGHTYGMPDSHLQLAKELLETCYQTYMKQPTQLAPEITYFAVNNTEEHDLYVKPNDAHNLLRPEFIESLYYFYALTGNKTYQDMGWTIFQAFEKHTKVTYGYSSIGNVKNLLNTRLRDMMESFWMGETLKYFYLLFSDNRKEIDLSKWIFNTEAHPLPIKSNK